MESSDRLSALIRHSAVCFILQQPRAQIKKEIRAKFQLSYGHSGGFSPFSLRRKKKKKKERKYTSAKPGWRQCTILGTILNAAEVTVPISSFGVVICTRFLVSYCSADQKKICRAHDRLEHIDRGPYSKWRALSTPINCGKCTIETSRKGEKLILRAIPHAMIRGSFCGTGDNRTTL